MADMPHTKICTGCKQDLPRTAFSKLKKGSNVLRARCKPCRSREAMGNNGWRSRRIAGDPDYVRSLSLKFKYGITLAEYDAMVAEQDGRCAICGTDNPRGRYNRLHVDHCHTTGLIRGLLCNGCNVALGKLGDTKEALLKVYRYVAGGPADVA